MTDDWGIDPAWVDAHDQPHTVDERTVQLLRSVIGRPPADLEETAPLVVRPGQAVDGLPGVAGPLEVTCEDGSVRQIWGTVPPDFPLGYQRLSSADGVGRLLIVSPGRCWLPEGWRAWGWTVQLYAARSASSWGFGDLRDLGVIREWAQRSGAGFLLVNPLHAVAPTFPQEPSPYLPASRRFRNPLYLDVEDVAGADLVDLADFRRAGHALRDLDLTDRDEVWRVKRDALRRIFDAVGANEDAGGNFAGWRAELGEPLEEFATWCVLADKFGSDFHDWPAEFHRADGPAVQRFRAEQEAEIAFFAWLQWALDEQIRSSTAGMTVLQDLPIGVDGGGADAWTWQDQLAGGVRIGAPPDLLNVNGQNWGSPPLIPWRMRAREYDAFIAAIRATMAATGGLRIDHVMGLFRLWWVPAGGSPTEGAYVRYPSADLLDIVALESHRAQAIVVGEDLGTVEPGVREAMAEHAILSYKLLLFEDDPPEQWPAQSMAAVTTHDLPTVAGLWSGTDLAEQLSLRSGPATALAEGAQELRGRLAPAAPDDGASNGSMPASEGGPGDGVSPESAVLAAYGLLARSPAVLLSATLEDAVAQQRRPNMPGITDRPNWALRMPVRIEDLPAHPVATAIAQTLNAAINRQPDPTQGHPAANLSSESSPDPAESGAKR
ncbi:MAG: 4-alpha-glucanotransferase [Actinomycetota bacterium]|nr:4-alpha-glucanotransferase [Actinomycetota bacterium]